jgi:hypothetical protein
VHEFRASHALDRGVITACLCFRYNGQYIGGSHRESRFAAVWVGVCDGEANPSLFESPFEGGQTDTSRADDEHVVARAYLSAVHPVQADRERFHQRGESAW